MRIAVIGTGNIGATLVRGLARAGHELAIANSRGPGSLADLAVETGATPFRVEDVAADSEVVVLSVPPRAVAELPAGLLQEATPDAFVIDTGNYVPHMRDGIIAAIEDGLAESRWTELQVGRPVVKVFNSISASDLVGSAGRRDPAFALPVAGDGVAAKAVAFRLVEQVGFEPVDAGGLDDSWRQQPGTPVYTVDLDATGVVAALAAAESGQTAAWRARMVGPR